MAHNLMNVSENRPSSKFYMNSEYIILYKNLVRGESSRESPVLRLRWLLFRMPISPTYTFWEDIWHLTWLLPALLCLSIFICLTLMYILAFIFSQRTDKWTTFLYRETAHCGCILRVSTLSSQFLYPQWLTKRGLGKWGGGKEADRQAILSAMMTTEEALAALCSLTHWTSTQPPAKTF